MKKRVITFFLKPLVLLMCVIMSMDMAAAGIDAAGGIDIDDVTSLIGIVLGMSVQ